VNGEGMFDFFAKYAYWKVLRYFALNSSSKVYVNELSHKLGLSAGMCSLILRELAASGILAKKELGNAHYYNLKENYFTTELKRFIGLFQIYRTGLVEKLKPDLSSPISIVLYGSYAKGDFTEESDIDILLITQERSQRDLMELEDTLDIEINIEKFTIGQWLKMKKEKVPFYDVVKRNHILLYGGELP